MSCMTCSKCCRHWTCCPVVLDQWARQWGVSADALLDLRNRMGIASDPEVAVSGKAGSETRQQALIRLDAAQQGVWLTRNNVGALPDARGVPVRYGLANESKAQNSAVKSADLIGMRSILIGPHHVGSVIAQFVSREAKHEGWTFKGDAHETAQLAWAEFVIAKGGDAAFCTGPGSFNYQQR